MTPPSARGATSAALPPEVEAGVSLGANLGDRAANLARAVEALAGAPGVRLVARSSIYETEPVDVAPQFASLSYFNAAAVFAVALPVECWSALCHSVEEALGRVRAGHHSPRPIDVDLLWFGDMRSDRPHLHLPHPQISSRRFVCEPLVEIKGRAFRVPGLARPLGSLLDSLAPRPWVRPTGEPWPVVAATSVPRFAGTDPLRAPGPIPSCSPSIP